MIIEFNNYGKSKQSVKRLKKALLYERLEEHQGKIACGIGVFASLYLGGIFAQMVTTFGLLPKILSKQVSVNFTLNIFKSIGIALTEPAGWAGIGIASVLVLMLYFFKVKPRIKAVKGKLDAERNFKYSESGAYGTSEWISDAELETVTEVKSIEATKGDILGIHNGKIVSLPTVDEFNRKHRDKTEMEKTNYRLNGHKAIAGSSGKMKSRTVSRNLMLQSARRNESVIVTDPKGELFEEFAEFFRNNGYDVKMLNLVDDNMQYSDSWNCLAEIRGNPIDAEIFAQAIIENVAEGETGYWKNNAQNLLKAVCQYVEGDSSIPTDMGQVYDLIANSTPAELDACFAMMPRNSPARRAYNIFAKCKDDVKGQILNGLGIFLSIFQSDIVREITGNNEISLEKPALEKCAYFIVTSDQHSTFDFLAILFYTMLFIRLVGVARKEPSGRAKVPINLILDEFPNIGTIPDFDKKISVVRSAGINIAVIFQTITQLQVKYPFGKWESIIGNCDTLICLGNTDSTTQEFFADKTGITTIEVSSESHKYDRERIGLQKDPDDKQTSSVGKRNLMNADEIGRMKTSELLVILSGHNPMKLQKFDYSAHPDSKGLVLKKVQDHIPEWQREKTSKAAARCVKPVARVDVDMKPEMSRSENSSETPMDLFFNTPPIAIAQKQPLDSCVNNSSHDDTCGTVQTRSHPTTAPKSGNPKLNPEQPAVIEKGHKTQSVNPDKLSKRKLDELSEHDDHDDSEVKIKSVSISDLFDM